VELHSSATGGISFGSLSERFGRRRIIIIAAPLSLVVLPF